MRAIKPLFNDERAQGLTLHACGCKWRFVHIGKLGGDYVQVKSCAGHSATGEAWVTAAEQRREKSPPSTDFWLA